MRAGRAGRRASAVAIPWPCVHEFLAIVTHARIYQPPTPLAQAFDQVEAWLESPSVVMLPSPTRTGHACARRPRPVASRPAGARRARRRALPASRSRELWSADRDFAGFRGWSCGIRWWMRVAGALRRRRLALHRSSLLGSSCGGRDPESGIGPEVVEPRQLPDADEFMDR